MTVTIRLWTRIIPYFVNLYYKIWNIRTLSPKNILLYFCILSTRHFRCSHESNLTLIVIIQYSTKSKPHFLCMKIRQDRWLFCIFVTCWGIVTHRDDGPNTRTLSNRSVVWIFFSNLIKKFDLLFLHFLMNPNIVFLNLRFNFSQGIRFVPCQNT